MAIEYSTDDWEKVEKPDVPPYQKYKLPIVKSERDDREYRVIKLENGLEATLVHDPKAQKAGASLDVAVGHLFDPDDMPGLAHFCEHLLFLGTEKYPRENEYSEFLTKHGGSSNAFTSTTNTNYFFLVSPSGLLGALDRFAPFFHSPLFTPSATARELKAVDSENKKNHQSDLFRMFQLNKHLSREGHPWSKFGTGNLETLSRAAKELQKKGVLKEKEGGNGNGNGSSSLNTPVGSRPDTPASSAVSSELEGDGGVVGREIRRRLIEWWNAEYSANRMRLCVIGTESLDELADTVSTLFSPIRTKPVDPLPMISGHPFGPNEMGTIVSAQTIMNVYCTELSFPIPYQAPFWKYQPSSFISHFIGHEGPGSAHSYLKRKGWITGLSSGMQQYGRGMGNLRVTIQLTREGFENIRPVILTIYKYLSLLRASPLPAWYQSEISSLSHLAFRFAEKRAPDYYAMAITDHMAYPIPRNLLISGPRTVQPWDLNDTLPSREKESGGEKEKESMSEGEKEVRDILEGCRAARGRVLLMGPKGEFERVRAQEGKDKVQWQTEKWYGTQYFVERFDEALLEEAEGPCNIPELFLPGPNAFIPTNLEVERREVDVPERRPHLVRETALSSLWHKKDDQFWIPRATAIFEIDSPVAFANARNATLTRLYANLVADSLTEFAYDAELTKLSYGFSGTDLGLNVTITGYNDKLHLFAQAVFERARSLAVTQERLDVIKATLKRDWENAFMEQPSSLADSFMTDLLAEKRWPLRARLSEIDSITVEEVQSYIVKLLSEVNIKALVTGNLHKEEAIRLLEVAEKELQSSPAPAPVYERAYLPNKATDLVWSMNVPNPNEPNSALTYHMHIGSRRDKQLRTTAQLLAQLMSDPAYNILRTREQLGYITFCGLIVTPGESELALRVLVQSERDTVYLEERVNAFLDEMQGILEGMSEEEFEMHKKGLSSKWKEQPKNLNEEAGRFWRWIENGLLEFNHNDTNAEVLEHITKADVLALFKSHVHYSSPSRAKTSVHLRSQKPAPFHISEQAIAVFEQEVKAAGVKGETSGWKDELFAHGEPTQAQVAAYWRPILDNADSGIDAETATNLVKRMVVLANEFPAKASDKGKLRPESVVIEDPKALRASRRISDYPVPVVQWGDQPLAKI